MRIPTSVFVMSAVVAVPFGLGIRDTLAHKEVSADEWGGLDIGDRSDRARERALEEYEATLHREEAEREVQAKERLTKLELIYDAAKPAHMGTLLEGIKLGSDAGAFQPEHVRQRIENATRDGFMQVSFEADAAALKEVRVTVNDYDTEDACETLGKNLAEAWGHSPTGVWLDPVRHQRASYSDCVLTFDRYVEPGQWVAQLPLSAIGMSAERFADQLGPAAEVNEDLLEWSLPGIGFGAGETKLEAYVVKGKIIGVKAMVASDFDTMIAVREALSTKLKAQPKKADVDPEEYGDAANVWEWKRRVPVALEQLETDTFTVLVGKMPWD